MIVENIEILPINKLKPYENNAKIHSDGQVEEIAQSINDFGFVQPILVDKNNVIVAGHGRWEAAKRLKMKKVPCVRAENLTEEQIKLFRLVDNRVATLGEIDVSMELSELEDLNIDFDAYSFDVFSIDDIDDTDAGDREEKDYFTSSFTFPTSRRKQIENYLKKHKDEIVKDIIVKAEDDG